MKWRPAPASLVALFDTALQAAPAAERRKMFGYPAAFAGGNMFAGLHQESFVLRLAPDDYQSFLKLDGAAPFEPMPGRTMRGYVAVPEAILQSPEALKVWVEKAFAHAASLPPKVPKTGGVAAAKRTTNKKK